MSIATRREHRASSDSWCNSSGKRWLHAAACTDQTVCKTGGKMHMHESSWEMAFQSFLDAFKNFNQVTAHSSSQLGPQWGAAGWRWRPNSLFEVHDHG